MRVPLGGSEAGGPDGVDDLLLRGLEAHPCRGHNVLLDHRGAEVIGPEP